MILPAGAETHVTMLDDDVSRGWVEGWTEITSGYLHKKASERCPPPLGGLFIRL